MTRASTGQTADCAVRLIEHPSEFESIKTEWQNLEAASSEPCFFQSYAWCGHVAETMTRAYPTWYAPLVAVAEQDGQTVAIWPLARQRRSGIWVLSPIDEPFGQFAGLLSTNQTAARVLVTKTLALVRQRALADTLRLERVIAGSHLDEALSANGAKPRGEVGAPFIDLSAFPDMAALKASRNKKTMKNLRNAINRLTKAGIHDHRAEIGNAAVTPIIEATLQRRSMWLKQKGLTAPPFRLSAHEAILTGGQNWGLDKMRVAFELRCAGRPLAHQWGFLYQKRYYAYMSATDLEAVQLSPGRLHLAFVIEDARRTGADAIEMLTPASAYKLVWTDTVRMLRTYAVPLSAAGHIHDLVWERSLRPALKACFYALPPSLRRTAAPVDGTGASDSE